MVIIFGRRSYGRVNACGDEYAHTTFAHIYYVPLIPIGSFWVTGAAGSTRVGFPIPLHGRSVLAAYLRVWAPVFAFAQAAVTSPIIGLPIGFTLLALSVWAWTWRSVRGELALRRSDYNRLAFGVRCEPAMMSPELRAELGAALRVRWDRLDTKRAPNDVGQFGAASPGEAVTAYGLLALSAAEHGGADERTAAERILRGEHDLVATQDGPYREAAAATPADVNAQIASAAATISRAPVGAAQPTRTPVQRRQARAKKLLIAGGIVGAIAAGGLIENVRSLWAPPRVAIAEVAGHGDTEFVEIACADALPVGELVRARGVTQRAFLCTQDERSLAVVAPAEMHDLPPIVVGNLRRARTGDAWFGELESHPHLAPVYLDVTSPETAQAEALAALAVAAVSLTLLGLGVRSWRRARCTAAS